MNYRMICRVLGLILLIYAGLLLLPMIAGLVYGESVLNFLATIGISAALGLLLLIPKPRTGSLVARDGFVIVGLGWISISLLGALPFWFSGSIPSYIDALFETASGLSTTGATILTDIEAMPRGDMFWRMFTHWIGGMGVLVFLMAVMPMSGEHSMHIMRAEVPGPTVGKLVPRVRRTAMILYLIYIGLTLLERREGWKGALDGVLGKDSGKTWLIAELINEFIKDGFSVGVVKHDGHDCIAEAEGTDTYKYACAGARVTAVYSDSKYVIRGTGKTDPEDLINHMRGYSNPPQIIILEGFKSSSYPKIVLGKDGEFPPVDESTVILKINGRCDRSEVAGICDAVKKYTDL